MIGIIPQSHQRDVIEEFFELFKTPWEFYHPGRVYDVIIATADEAPEISARLVLVYGSNTKSIDERLGIKDSGRQQGAVLSDRETVVPIYGDLLTLAAGSNGTMCVAAGPHIAGVRVEMLNSTVIRLGYDLFNEVESLLSVGQPFEYAHIPTLEIHIRMLREWMLETGLPFIEIPPMPAGREFIVCLTHDIDFIGIRQHRFDHSMWGFAYRATIGAIHNFMRGRLTLIRLFRSWLAAASVPFVYLGWARDFWEPFEWYLNVEKGLPATYFLIPFKRRAGDKVPGPHASRRATAYDVADVPQWTTMLQEKGCELGVHGIDAWHSSEKGADELARIANIIGTSSVGIRMHWLLNDSQTHVVLEQAGYEYDSTAGYNETPGYRAGTTQVYRPLGAQALLELPMHIQDGALFYRQRLNLSEPEAHKLCQTFLANADTFGGVLTVLWHDRSHGPERFWGDFYISLVRELKSLNIWFGTAGQVVRWFRQRRGVRFERIETRDRSDMRISYEGSEIQPPLRVRVHGRREHEAEKLADIFWDGTFPDKLNLRLSALPSSGRFDSGPCLS